MARSVYHPTRRLNQVTRFRWHPKIFVIRVSFVVTVIIANSFSSGCSSPAATLQHQAEAAGLEQRLLSIGDQQLVTYLSPQLLQTTNSELPYVYVFLEGDGNPWTRRHGPNADPNTRHSIVLPLLKQTPNGGIYLARPCYALSNMPVHCDESAWTSDRYSAETVSAMNAGLDTVKQQLHLHHFVLVGHSGGGALAMLMAENREDVKGVITLAGNLDHTAWTDHFNYLPLTNSLNPATQMLLPKSVLRWHLIASEDKTIPPNIAQNAAKADPLAHIFIVPNIDHTCCWQAVWQHFLPPLETILSNSQSPNSN